MFLTQKHEKYRQKIREFALAEIEPLAHQIDLEQKYPEGHTKKLCDMGILGLQVDPKYGGTYTDTLTYAIAVEELSRVCGSTGITIAAHCSLGTWPIFAFGSEEQKKKYLPPITKEPNLASFGLTEPEAGSDAGATRTTAVKKDRGWLINGSKCFITNASVGKTFVVTARTTPGKGTRGISSFILERGMNGFSVGKKENKMGLRGSDTATLHFDDLLIPDENRLGEEGQGFKEFMMTLDGGRVSIGAMALGLAQGALDLALKFAKERKQFGKSIIEHQAVGHKLADMATYIQAARHLIYHAAILKDKDVWYAKESAMCKLYASEIGNWCCYQAIQIMGAYGYSTDHSPVERYWRDVKLCEIGEGTSEIQRLVISRELLKDDLTLPDGFFTVDASKLGG